MLGRPSPVPSGMLGVCRWSPSGRTSGAFSQSVAEGCSSQQSECFCPQLGHSISHKTLAAASLGSGSSSKVPKTQIPSKPSWLFTCYAEDLFAPSCASKLKWKWQWFKAITKEAKRHEQVSMGNRWVMPTAITSLQSWMGQIKLVNARGICCSLTQKLSWGGRRAKDDLVLSHFKFGT